MIRIPEQDDFLSWREHPITALFLAAMRAYADGRKELWLSLSWEGANADEKTLHGLRGQADSVLWFANMTEVETLEGLLSGE